MIGSAPKPAQREEQAPSGATILPFRLRVGGADSASGASQAPAVVIDRKPAAASKRVQATVGGVASADRPTILPPRYRGWLRQALIAAVLLHLVAFAAMHVSFVHDVERAANAGGNASDGTTVLERTLSSRPIRRRRSSSRKSRSRRRKRNPRRTTRRSLRYRRKNSRSRRKPKTALALNLPIRKKKTRRKRSRRRQSSRRPSNKRRNRSRPRRALPPRPAAPAAIPETRARREQMAAYKMADRPPYLPTMPW